MRTMMHWEVKSQQAFTVSWTVVMRIIIGGNVLSIRNCATDDENDILTDKLVTYLKCGS
jgi:hypothetical protein